MKKIVTILCLFICCGDFIYGEILDFGQLPEGEYKEITEVGVSPQGLSGISSMSVGFVNLVWHPFTQLEDLLLDLLADGVDNPVMDNRNRILNFEIGYLVCIGFGVLFIVLVIFGGLITCCCRTCCSTCGGEYVQSRERTESSWRTYMAVMLAVFTILITLPCIFIFLINSWLTTVVDTAPIQLKQSLDNMVAYTDNIPKQVNFTTDKFAVVNASIVTNLENVNTTVGVPVRDAFRRMAEPTITQLGSVDTLLTSAVTAASAANSSVTSLKTGSDVLRANITMVTTTMETTLNANPNCTSVALCQELINSAGNLQVGNDIDAINTTDINEIINAFSAFNVSTEIDLINDEIDKIPGIVANLSEDATAAAVQSLNDANAQLEDINLDPSIFANITSKIGDVKTSIDDVSRYSDDIDQWRVLACSIAAASILLICFCYLFGLLLGNCNYESDPEMRGAMSKCGGVLLMTGAGLSFIFSWILMIIVVVFFTVGGHGERYVCQSIEAPYEGLKFLDKAIRDNSTILASVGTPVIYGEEVYFHDVVTSCEANKSLYEVLGLENSFNLTEIAENITIQLNSTTAGLKNTSIDLSSINVYTNKTEEDLDKMKTTGVENMDLSGMVTTAESGLDSVNILNYTQFIRNVSASIATADPDLAATINGFADSLDLINTNLKQPLYTDLQQLNTSINTIQNITSSINATVDSTKTVLKDLDTSIQGNGTVEVQNQLGLLGDDLNESLNSYVTWIVDQISHHLGACRPVYNVYGQTVTITCSYMMDILGGLWFSFGWSLFFLIPATILAMKLAKFYRGGKMLMSDIEEEDYNEEMEMHEYTVLPQQNRRSSSKLSLRPRSAKIHPSEYY